MNRIAPTLVALALSLFPLAASAQLTISGQVAVGTPVYANMAPPQPRMENPGNPPAQGYTWVVGYWNWSGTQYNWVPGRWDQPPQGAQAWEAPQWERDGQRFRFRPGRWGRRGMGQGGMGQPGMGPPGMGPPGMGPTTVIVQQPVAPTVVVAQPTQPQVVYAPQGPPRPRFERRAPPPGQGYVWVPGAWTWNGSQHVWGAGRWETPPRPRARWMSPQWRRHGRQWQAVPGRWR